MRISNRVRRNVAFTLLLVGITCIIARAWQVVIDPSSGSAWFQLVGIIILTYICFDRFRELNNRVKQGILFGRR